MKAVSSLRSPGVPRHGGSGGVSEWLKELVSKTSRCHSLVGSNPTPSARARERRILRFGFCSLVDRPAGGIA